ncbi:MAG: hypothetical protein MJ252_00910, partial [archaeon]|nr:hypothetical protein [archaeon]
MRRIIILFLILSISIVNSEYSPESLYEYYSSIKTNTKFLHFLRGGLIDPNNEISTKIEFIKKIMNLESKTDFNYLFIVIDEIKDPQMSIEEFAVSFTNLFFEGKKNLIDRTMTFIYITDSDEFGMYTGIKVKETSPNDLLKTINDSTNDKLIEFKAKGKSSKKSKSNSKKDSKKEKDSKNSKEKDKKKVEENKDKKEETKNETKQEKTKNETPKENSTKEESKSNSIVNVIYSKIFDLLEKAHIISTYNKIKKFILDYWIFIIILLIAGIILLIYNLLNYFCCSKDSQINKGKKERIQKMLKEMDNSTLEEQKLIGSKYCLLCFDTLPSSIIKKTKKKIEEESQNLLKEQEKEPLIENKEIKDNKIFSSIFSKVVEDYTTVESMDCGHHFDKRCLKEYQDITKTISCPICESGIKTIQNDEEFRNKLIEIQN